MDLVELRVYALHAPDQQHENVMVRLLLPAMVADDHDHCGDLYDGRDKNDGNHRGEVPEIQGHFTLHVPNATLD